MASVTVRQLDDKLKKLLRLRAARNGRSVEEEIRIILRSAAADGDGLVAEPETTPAAKKRDDVKRVLELGGDARSA